MNTRLNPYSQFGHAVNQVAQANQGDVDGVIAKLKDGAINPAILQQTPIANLNPLDTATLQLQAAVDALNGQWGVRKQSTADWYKELTGRTVGATVEVTFSAAEVNAGLEASRPLLDAMSAAVGQLSELGYHRTENHDQAVAGAHGRYIEARDAIIEKLGPMAAARRAGQLDATSGAQLGAFEIEFAGLRNAVRQMMLVF